MPRQPQRQDSSGPCAPPGGPPLHAYTPLRSAAPLKSTRPAEGDDPGPAQLAGRMASHESWARRGCIRPHGSRPQGVLHRFEKQVVSDGELRPAERRLVPAARARTHSHEDSGMRIRVAPEGSSSLQCLDRHGEGRGSSTGWRHARISLRIVSEVLRESRDTTGTITFVTTTERSARLWRPTVADPRVRSVADGRRAACGGASRRMEPAVMW